MVKLLKDAEVWKNEFHPMLENIYKGCELCQLYAPTSPRPIVSLPLARNFNDRVAMDLKHWRTGLWILHIIDMFSRFTVSAFINRKLPTNVIHVLMKDWIAYFGVMKSVLTDNGGEFSSDEMRDVMSKQLLLLLKVHGVMDFVNEIMQ